EGDDGDQGGDGDGGDARHRVLPSGPRAAGPDAIVAYPGKREARHTPGVIGSDPSVSLADVLAARERIGTRVQRTPMLSSAIAARFIAAGGGPRLADDRLY